MPAEVTMTWRPEAVPQDGIRSGSSVGRLSMFFSRSCRAGGEAVDALGEQVGERRDVVADRPAASGGVWSTTCTNAPRQIVIRKAMISVGTARRSAGSAIRSR